MTRRGHTSVAPGDCAAFSQAAMLRVDRELGPAESAALDAHLAVCSACRLKAAQAEALSSVLKRWDRAQAGAMEAPARLRMALRAAVADEGRWRRVESRRVRRLHLATAASVILVLGAGLLAGLGLASEPVASEPVHAAAWVPGRAAPLLDELPPLPGSPVAIARHEVPPSRLHDLRVGKGRPDGWLTAVERDEALTTLARTATKRLVREAFERDYGEDAFWFVDAHGGEDRLITRSAWMHLQSSPALRRLTARAPAPSLTVADPVGILDTGRTVADFLNLPGRRDALERALEAERREIHQGVAGTAAFGNVSLLLPGTGRRRAPPLGRTVDLAYAVSKGQVVLREGAGDDLVAVVHRTRYPVFIPAGELIGGGRVDRVVLEGTVLPVTRSARPVLIPCVAASSVGGRHGDRPTPTGMVGGPELRSLLARRTSVHEVRAWIASHVPILDAWGRDYSLLAFYDSTAQTANLKVLTNLFLGSGARGFALTDPEDGLVGVEVSDLPRESAAPLLARLLVGYAAEVNMAETRVRVHGEEPRERVEPRPSVVTLLDLIGSTSSFRARETRTSEARVLRMVEPRTGVGVEVVEDEPGGGAVLASGFAR